MSFKVKMALSVAIIYLVFSIPSHAAINCNTPTVAKIASNALYSQMQGNLKSVV